MDAPFTDLDRQMMRRCFTLAQKGRRRVHPNPMVGAVIVKNGRIIGEGFHRYFGGPHAEVEAFNNAREEVSGATLYCNLEPCCHTNKKTPPCTPLIISKRIRRVVVCNIDPNPEVSGKGLQQLREAGIEVQEGLLREEGEELNRFFFTAMREKRPFVTVKSAHSLDGYIARQKGRQTWLTSERAIRFVHGLRAEHDAVLVGAGTVRSDNPRLTVRHARGPQPKRIILSAKLEMPLNAHVFTDGQQSRTIVFTRTDAPQEKIANLQNRGVQVHRLAGNENGNITFSAVLDALYRRFGIASLLVEGGQQIFGLLVQQALWDEWIVLQTPKILGNGVPVWQNISPAVWHLYKIKRLDPDVALIYTKEK